MNEYTFTTTVRDDGKGSMKIAVTKACKALEISAGDYVEVVFKKVE